MSPTVRPPRCSSRGHRAATVEGDAGGSGDGDGDGDADGNGEELGEATGAGTFAGGGVPEASGVADWHAAVTTHMSKQAATKGILRMGEGKWGWDLSLSSNAGPGVLGP